MNESTANGERKDVEITLEDLEYVVGGLSNTQNAAKFIYDKSVNKEDCGNTSMTIL